MKEFKKLIQVVALCMCILASGCLMPISSHAQKTKTGIEPRIIKNNTVALKVLLAIGVSVLTLGTSITSKGAECEEKNITNCVDFQNTYGPDARYSGVYFNTEYPIFRELDGNIVGLAVSDDVVTIDYTDEHSFVDAIAILDNGDSEYISDIAEWTSSDNQVANVYNVRIDAVSVGSCVNTVSYEGYSADIEVDVLTYRDTLEEIQRLNANICHL